jgi:hypothetical protein
MEIRTFALVWGASTIRINKLLRSLLPFSVFHGFDAKKNVSGITIKNLTYMGIILDSARETKIRQQNTINQIIK